MRTTPNSVVFTEREKRLLARAHALLLQVEKALGHGDGTGAGADAWIGSMALEGLLALRPPLPPMNVLPFSREKRKNN